MDCYLVMCCPFGNVEITCEYTGTIFTDMEEAKKELEQARNDLNVNWAWIEIKEMEDDNGRSES